MKGDVPEELHKILRKARIGAGLTQASLANKGGCTQSAISMMEAGRREAISRESLVKLADLLGVELPDSEKTDTYETEFFPVTGIAVCGNFNCLSNMPYLVGDEIYFYPLGMAGHGKHCVICGELIMCKCQTCDA
ncbi:MAG: helix-turn-helix transcriptional regulator, partial [Lentisphaerae bacterium]|nr:helix-turn-helix transcriptional regulator [Lentisphaerota bacterium]